MRAKKGFYFSDIILIFIVAIGLFVAGFFLNKNTNSIVDNGVKTQATITQITVSGYNDNRDYHVYVEYTVDGQSYNNELGTYYTGMEEGQTIDIWYLKTDPNQITEGTTSNYISIITYSFGGLLVLVGGFRLWVKVRRLSLAKLKKTGRKVTAVVSEVRINPNFSINRRNPWKVFCQYGEELFKTPNNYDDIPNIKAGDSIDVYKSENGKGYYIDLASARENTNDSTKFY